MGHDVPADTTFVDPLGRAPCGAPRSATLFTPDVPRDTFALWAAFFSCLLAVYLAFSWVPSMLAGAGFSSSVASTGIMAFNLGGVIGALAGGVCITRWGSRASMLVDDRTRRRQRGSDERDAAVRRPPVAPIIAMLAVTGGLINGVQTTMYALAAHVYPAVVRATGVGTAVSFGRTGAVLSGYIGAWALEYRGAVSFFAVDRRRDGRVLGRARVSAAARPG